MNLAAISSAALRRLLEAARAGRLSDPIDELSLAAVGLQASSQLVGVSRATVEQVVEALLFERGSSALAPQLVWTGPDSKGSASRDTAVVLQELFREAQRSIVIAGFRFDHGATLLRELHRALAERSVSAQLFVDFEGAETFIEQHWPFGPPFPERFVFQPRDGVFASLHAKCVVVDSRRVFVTSANFTDRGQTRNIEVGVLLDDAGLAGELEAQLRAGAASGVFVIARGA